MKNKNIVVYSEEEIRRWEKVCLKEHMSYYPTPARFQQLRNTYDGDEFDVVGVRVAEIRVCTCHKHDHAPDCLANPHFNVCVIDPNDDKEKDSFEIPSTYLEPVFLKTEIIKNESAPEKDTTSQRLQEASFADAESQKIFHVVLFGKSGIRTLLVDDYSAENESFLFDQKDGGLIGDRIIHCGQIVPMSEPDCALIILEGDMAPITGCLLEFQRASLVSLLKQREKEIIDFIQASW